MIVKNESHIIERLLQSVLPLIDSYCICDTGSTDNTMFLIRRFFQTYHLSGKIVEEPFRDFAYNRNYALRQCARVVSETDYLLLVDADMVLEIDPSMDLLEFKKSLSEDAYSFFQGSDQVSYKNVRLVKNNPLFSYWGVTHEYIQLLPESKTVLLENPSFFLRDVGDGGSKKDKFERDIRLLKKGLKENPKNVRYTFYLANSLRDAGKLYEAIDVYLERIELGGWKEEVWYSYYSIGNCFRKLEKIPEAIYYWLEGYHFFPERLENVYKIIRYYREHAQYPIAYTFYSMARNSLEHGIAATKTKDHLFFEKDVYDYLLEYELSLIGYYCNWYQYDLLRANQTILRDEWVTEPIRNNVLSNYKFYAPCLEEEENPDPTKESSFIDFLTIGEGDLDPGPDFCKSTPSIVFDPREKTIVICVRYVNYRLSPTCGGYKVKDTITTKNRILRFSCADGTFRKVDDFWLQYDTSHDFYYCGIEDIRLYIGKDGRIQFNGNRVLRTGEICIEHGIIDMENQRTQSQLIQKKTEPRKVEKNWVLFGDNQVVYEWYPLALGEYRDEKGKKVLEIVEKKKTNPLLKGVRGSSNGVVIGEDIWFLCHVVSYEDKTHYYHLWVVMDRNTREIQKVSNYFTFGKGKRVEYSLGFLYLEEENVFLIGYSQMDCDTRFLTVNRSRVDGLFF